MLKFLQLAKIADFQTVMSKMKKLHSDSKFAKKEAVLEEQKKLKEE